jgi:4-coumarate--CoA ligase
MSHIFTSPYDDVEIPDVGIHQLILDAADRRGDHMAIIDGPSGRSMTFGQLADAIRRFAGGLAARGFGKGDVLAVISPNLPEYAVIFHGACLAGGTVTTVNPTYSADEIAYQLRDAGASLAITIGMFLPTVQKAVENSDVTDIFTIDPNDDATWIAELIGEPFAGEVDLNPAEDLAVLPYSSGTTGLAKGVMLTHRNLVANVMQIKPGAAMDDDEVVIAVLPFFHIYGMQVLMNAVLENGSTLVTMPRFDLEQFLSLIQEHKVTRAFVVPPIVLALAKHPLVEKYDLSSLKQVISGAAPLGADLAKAAGDRMGTEVAQGYGLTETSPVTNITPLGKARAGTVGILVPNLEMRIVNPDSGEDADAGSEGEIWYRGPNVMKGYLGRAQETGEMLDDDGWLHTGDIGKVDEDGYLAITDRLKELIKYKGFQVPPAELEAALINHPKIADVAVIGVADEEAGELPKAYVVPVAGEELTEDEVKQFGAEHLASYKRVRLVEFIDEIPKSLSGKILRRELRERERR